MNFKLLLYSACIVQLDPKNNNNLYFHQSSLLSLSLSSNKLINIPGWELKWPWFWCWDLTCCLGLARHGFVSGTQIGFSWTAMGAEKWQNPGEQIGTEVLQFFANKVGKFFFLPFGINLLEEALSKGFADMAGEKLGGLPGSILDYILDQDVVHFFNQGHVCGIGNPCTRKSCQSSKKSDQQKIQDIEESDFFKKALVAAVLKVICQVGQEEDGDVSQCPS